MDSVNGFMENIVLSPLVYLFGAKESTEILKNAYNSSPSYQKYPYIFYYMIIEFDFVFMKVRLNSKKLSCQFSL